MGGGEILQCFGRVIGAGKAGPSPARQACSECRRSWSMLRVRAATCSCQQQRAEMALHTGNQRSLAIDDWEFAGDSERFEPQYVRDRLIFGSVPTHEEVQDATLDLQDALKETFIPLCDSLDNATSSLSSSSVQQICDSVEVSHVQEGVNKFGDTSVNRTEPEMHERSRGTIQQLRHSSIYGAFHLLQNNPAVQGMVISLASDKAVWDAMLKNEKVIEFRRSLQKGESKLEEKPEDSDKPTPGKKNAFIQALENAKVKVIECMEKIAEVINHFLGFTDKKGFVEIDGDFLERALKASMMLSVAVLLVVVVKRGKISGDRISNIAA